MSSADIAEFRHQRQQTHAYGRSHVFPCFDQISPDIWAVVEGLVSCTSQMWEGVDVIQYYLDSLGNGEDLKILKFLVNRNEHVFLDVLQEMYPGHKDQGPNAMFAWALNSKMPTTFMMKNDLTKLNEFFGKLHQSYYKGNFTIDQLSQICRAIKSKLDTSNQVHQPLIAHAFNPCPTLMKDVA